VQKGRRIASRAYHNRGRKHQMKINHTVNSSIRIDVPLITLRGYALDSKDVKRMHDDADRQLRETRKELGLLYK